MEKIDISSIENRLNNKYYISEGKELKCFDDCDDVIKIFHKDRKSKLKIINLDGIIKLSTLDLKHFNKPTALIYEGDNFIGFKEKKLDIKGYDSNEIKDFNYFIEMLNEIKEDIKILSNNGFQLEDIFYNYTFNFGNITFFDFTSYKYIQTEEQFLKDYFYKKNIQLINTFLVGLTLFDAFKLNSNNEYVKIFKSTEYVNKYLNDNFYGDYILNNQNVQKNLLGG